MDGMANLVTWAAIFVGSHFLMSHPLRAAMVARLGANGFALVYSFVSLGTFIVMLRYYAQSPDTAPLWAVGDLIWWIATVLMLIGSILFVGSFTGNPAMPRPDAAALTSAPARGVFAITRHPMMWGFALWSLVHVMVAPMTNVIILCVAMAFLALVGAWGQDHKKVLLMGDNWKDWSSRTSYFPFANQLSGKASWASAWPGRTVLLLGTLFWLVATYSHGWFGIQGAGIWRWIWA